MNNPAEESDEACMVAYQLGEIAGFDELYRRHSGKVRGYLRTRMSSAELADEASQAVFLKLHQVRHQYDRKQKFLPWMFTICRSVMIDTIRKQNRHTHEELAEPMLAQPADVETASEPMPADLSRLPEKERKAIELRYQEDSDFGVIAEKLKTSPANARQLVSRGIRRLKSLVKEEGALE